MKISNQRAVEAIRAREAFRSHTGSFTGQRGPIEKGLGLLPREYRERYWQDVDSAGAHAYVVFSYGTPIGWCCDGAWTVPTTKYSRTTTHHQNLLSQAIPFVDSDGLT